jgi:hypothetical protein
VTDAKVPVSTAGVGSTAALSKPRVEIRMINRQDRQDRQDRQENKNNNKFVLLMKSGTVNQF